METIGSPHDFLSDLFPEVNAEVRGLFAAAAEHAGLVSADFLGLRDLLVLSGYDDSETLQVVLLLLLIALEEGSLCLELSESSLRRRLDDLLPKEKAAAWAARLVHELKSRDSSALIGRQPEDNKPVILWRAADREFLYFQKYLRHDLIFRAELQKRLAGDDTLPPPANLRTIIHEVLVTHPLTGAGGALKLDPCQRTALGVALLGNFAVISGGPGTGKTSIVVTLLRCLVRLGVAPDRIALAAPTGRAAQRLTDALRTGLSRLPPRSDRGDDARLENLAANTLHSLLRYNPARETFGHHRENPVPADVVIVDEVSMIGLVLMSRLLQALRPDARLILLGDKDQLPSVDAGAVLAGLVPPDGKPRFSAACAQQLRDLLGDLDPPPPVEDAPHDYLVVLEENYRSQADIREVAAAVNRQEAAIIDRLPVFRLLDPESVDDAPTPPTPPTAPTPPTPPTRAKTLRDLEQSGGCWFLPLRDNHPGGLRRLLLHWAERQYLVSSPERYEELVARIELVAGAENEARKTLDELFRVLGHGRLLTLLREGPWGCVDINRFLAQHLRPRWDSTRRGFFFAGAPVLVTRNDHARQLYNGDVGIALRARGGGLRVVFPRAGGYVSYPADTLPASELGFALTVHKSQGSEYAQVLLLVPPTGGRRLLTKEMIYTAITRAKDLAILCGTRDVLQLAISRRILRESGLPL